MAKCDYCGSTIWLGGVRQGNQRFCNETCRQNSLLLALVREVPAESLQAAVESVHAGPCPRCQRVGTVDAHTSYRVWSIFFLTVWSNRPAISCRSCGLKRQLGDLFISLLFGWWGIPSGIILTPVQIGRNIHAMLRPPDPAKPSPELHRLVCLGIASQLAAKQQAPPPLPAI